MGAHEPTLEFNYSLFRGLVLAGLCLFATLFMVSQVHAQCGDYPPDSTCYQCHELEQVFPVNGKGEWHDIHAQKDCCWNCHGGNSQAQDKDTAHQDMMANPLMDISTDCYPCHPLDYPDRAERFAGILGVSPGGIEPPASPPIDPSLRIEHPIVILPRPEPTATSGEFFLYFGPFLAAVLILTITFVAWRLRQPAS
jgi:hypothetical protein